ncbi:MAG: endolytic transglycosylase MltG [Gammaproteobacteria bacterium]|nr:MAG: endolytic transglycosylase MltG [Gammaproteobacteria bacterium]
MTLPPGGAVLEVPRGTTLQGLARTLEARGWIRNAFYLRLLGRETGLARHLQAGEYPIEPGTTPRALLQRLGSGRVKQYPFTIVEGTTWRTLRAKLLDSPVLTHRLRNLTDAQVRQALGIPWPSLEGAFLPETWFVTRGESDLDLLRRAWQALRRALEEEWRNRAPGLPLHTPYEALVLASIVEKETAVPEERARIAGVLIRRLQRGMRLQADPTVIYGLGTRFDGNLRRRDLRRDTPWNTYTRKGLPPTPIAMAGRAALHATLHPAPGDALYYVARGDGRHVFSATLEAHRRAVRRYQLKK